MRPGLTDRRTRVERRLFDADAQLRKARSELEVIDAQLGALRDDAEEAHVRMIVSETPLANRVWRDAQGHVAVLEKERATVSHRIVELRRLQDELFGKLVI